MDRQQRRADTALAEQWRLECLGREFALKASGSKRHGKKEIQDRTFDNFGLLPPLAWTHHAQQRLKERGRDSIPRFVPGTYRTLVSTVVPMTEGKRNYRLYAKRHKLYLQREQARRKKSEQAAARRLSMKAMRMGRRAEADTRRRKHRKRLAEKKRCLRTPLVEGVPDRVVLKSRVAGAGDRMMQCVGEYMPL